MRNVKGCEIICIYILVASGCVVSHPNSRWLVLSALSKPPTWPPRSAADPLPGTGKQKTWYETATTKEPWGCV